MDTSTEGFVLRNATKDDARFLATCLMEAMGGKVMERMQEGTLTAEDERKIGILTEICERDDTLYTWRFGTIAETSDGCPVGASIAYPGDDYHERMLTSFSHAKAIVSFDVQKMEDESQAGEMYLDTLVVVPTFRRRGVAQALMRRWLQQAEDKGLTATLAVARDNAKAHSLYESMGLRDASLVFIFGDHYQKMRFVQDVKK